MLDLRDAKDRPDVYHMMIVGFTNTPIVLLYIVCQLLLMLHLSHGIASIFQTLGLNTPRTQSTWRYLGWAVTLAVGGGNLAIVAAVWTGIIR